MSEIISPLKAIRAKCLDCVCEQPKEVRMCPCVDCPLYAFRLGKNPYRKQRELSDEQRKAISNRLAAARKKTDGNYNGN